MCRSWNCYSCSECVRVVCNVCGIPVHAIADCVICDKWLGVADSDEHSDCNEHERE